ncbi:creatininase family protein [Halomonas urumqiensis]|uniref:Creatininase n=1 Tax=Halomonas urumqiensis TaxID=1684789 RepID=A0A2N7UDD5_9GAMM|nr:creatininase family protein [Halomonas urumqiensis]PMR78439.1 creatininase [Halomonas urumqiensis]PTB03584.1 creatininase family protein [Halomonas urumqiensis]GHE20212.1 creatininase [Halomonas urumqiensis]
MTAPPPFPHWQSLTSHELAALPRESVAVMVLGAIEQHGAHLPLSTDLDIGQGLLDAALLELPERFPLVILPPMAVGASDEHLNFPGTLSLAPELAIATLEAYGEAVARAGLSRLVLLNSHGGNKAVMDLAALKLRRRLDLLVVKVHYMRMPLPDNLPGDGLPADELRHGLHGGAIETAMMRHLAPRKVRLEQLSHVVSRGQTMADQDMRLGPEGEAAFAWLAEDLHPGGVVGDARLGTAEIGKRLVAHYGRRIADLLMETADTRL